jgi:hypothetical protein
MRTVGCLRYFEIGLNPGMGLEPGGALLATPGSRCQIRIRRYYDTLSCIRQPRLDEGRSGSPPDRGRFSAEAPLTRRAQQSPAPRPRLKPEPNRLTAPRP